MPVETAIGNLLLDWRVFAFLGLMISTILAALVYMIGNALLNDKMKTWGKMELTEILYSAVILLAAFGLVPIIDGIINEALDITGSPPVTYLELGGVERQVDICSSALDGQEGYEGIDACHMRLAIYYLRTIFEEGEQLGDTLLIDYAWVALGGETSVTVQTLHEKNGMIMWTPWKGFFTVRSIVLETVFNWNMTMMFLAKFQEIFMKFIAIAAFPVLFASGVVFRTFTFSRRLGGLLIGLGLALYYVFPAFYTFGALVMIDLKEAAHDDWVMSPANPGNQFASIGVPVSQDPPIINTIYLNMTEDKKLGEITVLESMDKQYAEEQRLKSLSKEEREMEFAETMDSAMDFDLGNVNDVSETEKENIIVQMGKTAWGIMEYYMTHNLVLGTVNYWRPDGYIEVVSRLTFFAMFFALFGSIGTIAATRSLSGFFGGDIELAGLTRLI